MKNVRFQNFYISRQYHISSVAVCDTTIARNLRGTTMSILWPMAVGLSIAIDLQSEKAASVCRRAPGHVITYRQYQRGIKASSIYQHIAMVGQYETGCIVDEPIKHGLLLQEVSAAGRGASFFKVRCIVQSAILLRVANKVAMFLTMGSAKDSESNP